LLQLFGGGVYGESYLIQKPEEWLTNLVSQKLGWWKELQKNRLSWPNIWTWLLLQLFGGGVYGESYLHRNLKSGLRNIIYAVRPRGVHDNLPVGLNEYESLGPCLFGEWDDRGRVIVYERSTDMLNALKYPEWV